MITLMERMPFPFRAGISPLYPMSYEEEAGYLKNYAQALKEELDQINKRIDELEKR